MKKEVVEILNRIKNGEFLDPHDPKDEKILKAQLPDGTFIATHQIRAGFVFNPEDIKELEYLLMTPMGDSGNWLIIEQFKMGHFLDPEKFEDILLIRNEKGVTLAHKQALYGYRFNPKNRLHLRLLLVQDKELMSVAHCQALAGYRFNPEDEIERRLLYLKTKSGTTVAHCQVAANNFFDPDNPIEFETLKLADKSGYTVAHKQAFKGYAFDVKKDTHYELLKLKDNEGTPVALQGCKIKTEDITDKRFMEILKLSDNTGYCVAHEVITPYMFIYSDFLKEITDPNVLKEYKKILSYASYTSSDDIYTVEGDNEEIRELLGITQSYVVKINLERNIPSLTETLQKKYNIPHEVIEKIRILSNGKEFEKYIINKLLMENVIVNFEEENQKVLESLKYIDDIYEKEIEEKKSQLEESKEGEVEREFFESLKEILNTTKKQHS